ncbi:hypothetical protein [Propylenella binzhouense]|uniref:Uncharacterized protein n=1 Tax=Propylenella binzhouense TaxID=2555902 RepID=A0A964TA08_9HYPH|nr:hypothetical protein [Propylenella binzhouense]MYZ50067.1 hypothetical protein [Propylenella binzhouense]
MDESRRHVVEDYPAEKLPEELRGDIDPSHRTRVIVEDVGRDRERGLDKYRRLFGRASHMNTSVEEAVARIRALRDEWDA